MESRHQGVQRVLPDRGLPEYIARDYELDIVLRRGEAKLFAPAQFIPIDVTVAMAAAALPQ